VNKLELVEVGHSKKPKGIDGYLKIHIEEQYVFDVSNARAIFLDLDGSRVPFLIEKFVIDSQLLIKLDEVDSPQDAEACASKTLYLDAKEVTAAPQEDQTHPLVAYAVIDQDSQPYGHIVSIEEYPNQLMAFITKEELTIMLPLHEDNILDLNETDRIIQLDIPEGMDELYES
jgi:16S rRNA processing protein RimM